MIEAILPAGVAVAESFGDPPGVRLFPEEAAAIRRAVDKRRREYATVRHCARRALADLGLPPVAILNGTGREPMWPAGVVGSMTHCDGYRAAALAPVGVVASLGIDAEPHAPVSEGLLPLIGRPDELPRLAALAAAYPEVHWDRLLFSAKESVYKAWYPLARRWLGFEEARLDFHPGPRAFTVTLHQAGPQIGGRALTAMRGRWLVQDGLLVTAVVIGSG